MRGKRFLPLIASLTVLALPSSALAVTSTSEVTGAAASELSLTAATPSAMAFTHSSAGSATSAVAVTSTAASWTLSIHDAQTTPTGHTAGRLSQLNNTCASQTGFATTLSELTNALTWSSSTGSSGTMSGSAATVRSGALVEALTMTFGQTLASSEDVPVSTCYKGTVTYTLT